MNYIAFDCHRRYTFARVEDASVRVIGVRPPYGFMSQRGRKDVSAQAAQKKEGVIKEGDEMT